MRRNRKRRSAERGLPGRRLARARARRDAPGRAGARARRPDRSRRRRRRARRPGSGSRRSRSSRSSQVRQGAGIQSSPRKARNAGESFQSSPSGRVAHVLERRGPAIASAWWHGERDAVGRDDQVAARPAVHAGARAIGVVVGAHEEDLHLAAQALARRGGRLARASSSGGARRQERVAVGERPAEVLRVGQLEPLGAEPLGQRDELRRRARCCRGGARR